MAKTNLEKAIEQAAANFALQIVEAVKESTLQELMALQKNDETEKPGRKPGRPAKAKKAKPGRKPGRPAKTKEAKPGRKPGRPAKTKTAIQPKRKPGRPKKNS